MAHTESQNGFLVATGEYQLILEEVWNKDGTLSMELLNEIESRMGCLLLQGYHSMTTKRNPVLAPQEYYQGCTIVLIARLCKQSGRRPKPITDCLRDCLYTTAASKQLLLNLVLDRSHVGLKMQDWLHVLGFVSTVQATVATVNRRQGQRKTYLQGNELQQPTLINRETISQDNLEALWVVPLSYVVGFVVYDTACRQREGGTEVLSWEKHIRPTVETTLYSAFPRLGPAEYIDAGIALLQLDLLQDKSRNKADELDTKHVSHKLKGSLVKVLLWTTGLPRYTLLARFAQIFLGRLDRDNTDDIVHACTRILQQASPMEYIASLDRENWRALSKGENVRLFTNGNWIAAEKCNQGDGSITLGFPLLTHIDALLVEDNAEQAINIAVRMEHCLVLSEDNQLQAWTRVVNYLFQTGHIFLDGFPVCRPEYLANRRFILEMIMTRSGPLGLTVFIEAYKNVLARVAGLKGNVTEDEHEYLQRACHQTVLRILQAKYGEEAGIEKFKESYLKHVEGIAASPRVQLSSLMVCSSKKEQMNWAFDFLCQTNKVPDSLRLDDNNRPDLPRLFHRGESIPGHFLLTTDRAKGPATAKNEIHAVVLDDEGSRAAEMDVSMECVDANVQERLQEHAYNEGTDDGMKEEVEGDHFMDSHEMLQDGATKDDIEDDTEHFVGAVEDDDSKGKAIEDHEDRKSEKPEHPAESKDTPEDTPLEEHASSSKEGEDEEVRCAADSNQEEVKTSALLQDKDDDGHESEEATDEECSQEQLGGAGQDYEQWKAPFLDGGGCYENKSVQDKECYSAEEKVNPDQQDDEVIDIVDEDDDEGAEVENIAGGNNYEDGDTEEEAPKDGNYFCNAEVEVPRHGREHGQEHVEVGGRDENEDGSPGEIIEANANQSMDEVSQYEAGSQTGYEPEDTHGFTEEEVSEAMHTEDEEEERLEAGKVIQASEDSKEHMKIDTADAAKHRIAVEPHTLSDMDAADEHTTGQEEDLGAESSEQDEGDGTYAPRYPVPKADKTAEGPSLMAFAVRAQRQADPDCSPTPTYDTRTDAASAPLPWHWSARFSPAADVSTNPQWRKVGKDSALPQPESEAENQATTAASDVVVDAKWDRTTELGGPGGAQLVATKLGCPTAGKRQSAIKCASVAAVSAARFGSASFIDSPNHVATDDESSPQKVVVDCVPEFFEHSTAKSSKQLIAADFPGKLGEPGLHLPSKSAPHGLSQQDEWDENADVQMVRNNEDKAGYATRDGPNKSDMKPAAINNSASTLNDNADCVTWNKCEKSDAVLSAHEEERKNLHVVKMDLGDAAREEEVKGTMEWAAGEELLDDGESKESPQVAFPNPDMAHNEKERIDKLAVNPIEVAAGDAMQHDEMAKVVDAEMNDAVAETKANQVLESPVILEDKSEVVDEEAIDVLEEHGTGMEESKSPTLQRPIKEDKKYEESGKVEDTLEDTFDFLAGDAKEKDPVAATEVENLNNSNAIERKKSQESKLAYKNEREVEDTVQERHAEKNRGGEGVVSMAPAEDQNVCRGMVAEEPAEVGSSDNEKHVEGEPSNESAEGAQPYQKVSMDDVVVNYPNTVNGDGAYQEKVNIQEKLAVEQSMADEADDHEDNKKVEGHVGSNLEAKDEQGKQGNESPLNADVALAELAFVADIPRSGQKARAPNDSVTEGSVQGSPSPVDTSSIVFQSISIPDNALSPAMSSVAASDDGLLHSPLHLPVATMHSSEVQDANKGKEEGLPKMNRKRSRQCAKAEEPPKTHSMLKWAKETSTSTEKVTSLKEEASDEESVAVAVMADEVAKPIEVEPVSDGERSLKGGQSCTITLPTSAGKRRRSSDVASDTEEAGEESDAINMVEDIKDTQKNCTRTSRRVLRARASSPTPSISSRTSQHSTKDAVTGEAEEPVAMGSPSSECKPRRSARKRKLASKLKAAAETPRHTRRGSKTEEGKGVKEEDESTVGSQGTHCSERDTTNTPRLRRGSKQCIAAADMVADNQSIASSLRLRRGSKRRQGEEVKESQQEEGSDGNDSTRSARREKKQKLAIEDDLAPIPEEEALASPPLNARAKRRIIEHGTAQCKQDDSVAEFDEVAATGKKVATKHAPGAKENKSDEDSRSASVVEEVELPRKRSTRSHCRREKTDDKESVPASAKEETKPRSTRRKGKKGTHTDDELSVASAGEEGKSSGKGKAPRSNRGAKTKASNVEVSVADWANDNVSVASSRTRATRGSKRIAQAGKEEEPAAEEEAPQKRATRRNAKGKAKCVKEQSDQDEEGSMKEEKLKGKSASKTTHRGKRAAAEATDDKVPETKINSRRKKMDDLNAEDEQATAKSPKKTSQLGKKKACSTDEDEVSVAESTASSVRRSGRVRKPRRSYKC